MIIHPPKWWSRRQARILRAATRKSKNARRRHNAMLAAERLAYEERRPELRKTAERQAQIDLDLAYLSSLRERGLRP
jgi:hypothetical protein